MSHDIRTPINGIRGMVEISRRYVGDEAKQEECREKIMTASGFLLDLVNDVLNMNKLESGAVTLELGGKNYRVRKGDSFSFKPSQQHDLKNTGKTPATVLWVCTPPNF